MSEFFVLHSLVLGSSTIRQLESVDREHGVGEILLGAGGSPDMSWLGVGDIKPVYKFATPMLKTLLSAVGFSGLAINYSNPTATVYYQKMADGGTRSSGSAHRKHELTKAMVLLRSITLPVDKEGSATFEIALLSDGTNAPIIITANVALPGGTHLATEAFTLGPVVVGAGEIDAVQEATIDTGKSLTVEKAGAGNDTVYPTFAAIEERKPKITLKHLDASADATYLVPVGVSTFAVYGRRMLGDGSAGRYSDASAEHIKFSGSKAGIFSSSSSAKGLKRGEYELTLTPLETASAAGLVITSGCAVVRP